jgi:pimeloyl-ACP methyl ester carboxylesterase
VFAPDASPRLAHTLTADNGHPAARVLYVLHGIFGRGRNWGAVSRHLLARRPDWSSVLLDLRLHGNSPSLVPPHTVDTCARDVLAFELSSGLTPRAVLGHSFGGKVALLFAALADIRPLQVWVIDSTPEARPPDGSAWGMLRAVRSMPQDFVSRLEAVLAMQQRGVRGDVAAWMSTNLVLSEGRYRWKLDFEAVEALLVDFFRVDAWDLVESPPDGVELHFVKATESETLSETACARIGEARRRHGRVQLHRVFGGHWLNTDNPEAVLSLLSAGLPRE